MIDGVAIGGAVSLHRCVATLSHGCHAILNVISPELGLHLVKADRHPPHVRLVRVYLWYR
jgi:hypothetical protein